MQSDDGEASQMIFRRTHRDSFYDNVPSNSSSSTEFSQRKLANDQEGGNDVVIVGAHARKSSMGRLYERASNSSATSNMPQKRITEVTLIIVIWLDFNHRVLVFAFITKRSRGLHCEWFEINVSISEIIFVARNTSDPVTE